MINFIFICSSSFLALYPFFLPYLLLIPPPKLNIPDVLYYYLLSSSTRLVGEYHYPISLMRRQKDKEWFKNLVKDRNIEATTWDSKPVLSDSKVRVIPPVPSYPPFFQSCLDFYFPLVMYLLPEHQLTSTFSKKKLEWYPEFYAS